MRFSTSNNKYGSLQVNIEIVYCKHVYCVVLELEHELVGLGIENCARLRVILSELSIYFFEKKLCLW